MSKRHKRARPSDQPSDQREGLWVSSDVTPDGSYVVAISLDGDRSWVLTPAQVQRYATACVAAAQRAEYDAAVLKLLRSLGLEDENTVVFIAEQLRPDRPPLDDEATAPLTLVPGVNATATPFVILMLDGRPGSWTPVRCAGTRCTCWRCRRPSTWTPGLLRALLTMGLDEPVARNAAAHTRDGRAPNRIRADKDMDRWTNYTQRRKERPWSS